MTQCGIFDHLHIFLRRILSKPASVTVPSASLAKTSDTGTVTLGGAGAR